jgi:hypothetical protein
VFSVKNDMNTNKVVFLQAEIRTKCLRNFSYFEKFRRQNDSMIKKNDVRRKNYKIPAKVYEKHVFLQSEIKIKCLRKSQEN